MKKTVIGIMIVLLIVVSSAIVVAPVWYGTGDDAGLVGRWSCEGNFKDSSGQGNNGTQSGGVTITNGIKGRGCQFDGTDDYITTTRTMNNNNVNYTYSVWIKPTNYNNYFLTNAYDSWYSGGSAGFIYNSTSIWWRVATNSTGTTYDVIYNSPTSLINTWTHVTFVGIHLGVNQTNHSIYLNGQFVKAQNYTYGYTTPGSYVFIIGKAYTCCGAILPFKGSIDEVRLYNRSLSEAEILALYNTNKSYKLEWRADQTLGGSNETPVPVASDETGLVGYWKMDNLADGNTTDSHIADSTQRNGSILGATLAGGRWSYGYSFDGNDAINTLLNVYPYTEFSLSAWAKFNSSSSAYQTIIAPNYGRAGIFIDSRGNTTCRTFPGGFVTGPMSLNDAKWHHIACTYFSNLTTNITTVYVDGAYMNQMSAYPAVLNDPDTWIGGDNPHTTVDTNFTGIIDEVRVYNKTLSAPEVQELYLSKGLVGYWKMDADQKNSTSTFDTSGYNNHGLITGATFTNEGRFKEAYKFDGTNDDVNIGKSLIGQNQTFSLIFWAKRFDDLYKGMVSEDDASNRDWFIAAQPSSGIYFTFWQANGTRQAVWSAGNFPVNTWTQVGIIIDPVNKAAYMITNGVKTNYTTSFPSWDGTLRNAGSGTSTFRIGTTYSSGFGYNFNGTIDEVRIYNRGLTASEIATLYNGTKSYHLRLKTVPG
jgi:hypothetical protein